MNELRSKGRLGITSTIHRYAIGLRGNSIKGEEQRRVVNERRKPMEENLFMPPRSGARMPIYFHVFPRILNTLVRSFPRVRRVLHIP